LGEAVYQELSCDSIILSTLFWVTLTGLQQLKACMKYSRLLCQSMQYNLQSGNLLPNSCGDYSIFSFCQLVICVGLSAFLYYVMLCDGE